ncbi:hypothetical protein [Neolewinella agarilytica]|uniref:hypothetical protein n=1 Tax=Neolewinella agarilytica TaxID=478744 RepID=UPI002352CBE0|nr:hypothetical protein [Neolewinella agarilytica]
MPNSSRHTLLFVLLLASCVSAAQDVEATVNRLKNLKEQQLSITGGINLTSQFYDAVGIANRRDNFQWVARANLNFSFLGINAPFSFVFSEANQNFGLPSYSFVGISPRYKWATLHAGDRSMSFSRYTMGGISFRGGGLTLEPGKFHFSGFYGKLNRALANDLNTLGDLNGFYQRNGYGFRMGYGGKSTAVYANFFAADDQEADGLPPQTELGPVLGLQNNKVISIEGRQQLGKNISLFGELAHSAFNGNRSAAPLTDADTNFGNSLLGLFSPTEETQTGQAYQIGLAYNQQKYGLQARYERITRGFRTLGALFFNKDSENITLGLNRSFLENKLTVFVNGGLERTNLDSEEQESTNRIIASANLNYRPTDKWMLSGGYSNFRNDTKLRARTNLLAPVDSIFLAQVNQSANVMVMRQLGNKDKPSSVRLMLMRQQANNIINDEVNANANSLVTIASLAYTAGNPDAGLQWNTGLTYNRTNIGMISNNALSPTLGVNKNFFNNALATHLQSALSLTEQNGDNNRVFNLSLGGTYRLANSHRLGLRANHINRFGSELADRNFREWYGSLTYGYSFGGALGRKEKPATESPPTPEKK